MNNDKNHNKHCAKVMALNIYKNQCIKDLESLVKEMQEEQNLFEKSKDRLLKIEEKVKLAVEKARIAEENHEEEYLKKVNDTPWLP